MKTSVVFRKFKTGEIIAIFPYSYQGNYMVASYMHIGQHNSSDLDIISITKLATPEEYHDLLQELQAIGYDDLKIIKRIQHRKLYK